MKSFSVIIQIKDTEHEYFPVVLFVMPYKVVSPYLTLNTSIPPEVEPTLRSLEPTLMSAYFPKARGTLPTT